jgi:type IV secretory pathway component VirB8
MGIAMSNVMALMRWHNFRFLQNFSNRDFAWLLIGAFLAVAVMWIISRRKRRWL